MNPYLLPLNVALRPSLQINAGLLLSHGTTLLVLPAIALPVSALLALAAAVLVSLYLLSRRHSLRAGDPITHLLLLPTGEWWLTTRKQPPCLAWLRTDSVVHPRLTVLSFRLHDGRRRSTILTSDNCDAAAFRRLRVRLRFLPLAIQPG